MLPDRAWSLRVPSFSVRKTSHPSGRIPAAGCPPQDPAAHFLRQVTSQKCNGSSSNGSFTVFRSKVFPGIAIFDCTTTANHWSGVFDAKVRSFLQQSQVKVARTVIPCTLPKTYASVRRRVSLEATVTGDLEPEDIDVAEADGLLCGSEYDDRMTVRLTLVPVSVAGRAIDGLRCQLRRAMRPTRSGRIYCSDAVTTVE